VFDKDVDEQIKIICIEISKRYEINFLEIGVDKDHVHFLIQSVPKYSPKKNSPDNQKHNSKRDFSEKT
jgi:REP element-mobilizing transposase RayT